MKGRNYYICSSPAPLAFFLQREWTSSIISAENSGSLKLTFLDYQRVKRFNNKRFRNCLVYTHASYVLATNYQIRRILSVKWKSPVSNRRFEFSSADPALVST